MIRHWDSVRIRLAIAAAVLSLALVPGASANMVDNIWESKGGFVKTIEGRCWQNPFFDRALLAAPEAEALSALDRGQLETLAGAAEAGDADQVMSLADGLQGQSPELSERLLLVAGCNTDAMPTLAANARAALAMLTPPRPPQPEVVSREFTLSGSEEANFEFDSAQLTEVGRAELDTIVDFAREADELERIQIVGHTDALGSAEYNQQLSEQRARAARDYLVSQGVNSNVIVTIGRGESEPVASNATPEGRAENRRVEVSVRGVRIETVVEEN